MNNYLVYKHTFPNGKVYIGITSNEPNKRWKNGFGYVTQKKMFNSIVRYGWDNIKHEILYRNLNKQQAFKLEEELITFYKSNNYNFGYNIYSNKTIKGANNTKTHSQIMKEYYNDYSNRMKLRNRNAINKPVVCVETGIIYKSTAEATRLTGCNHISSCCKNSNKTSKNYHWKYID